MPISRIAAESAIRALIACNAGEMFDKIRGNQHSMEKHFSKQAAMAAADDNPQGYFKRIKNISIASSADLNAYRETKIFRKALDEVGAKKPSEFGKKLKRRTLVIPQKSAAQKDDILDLVTSVISAPDCELRENRTNQDTRFLAVSPVPDGFYGRSIDNQGNKTTCGMAVVIVNAAATTNPQIVTIFPAGMDYVNRHRLLT